MPLQATSGAASYDAFGGGVPYVPIYIEEVFSTFLYTGNGSTQTITNGIDLAGKGGLVWIKARSVAESNQLVDTVRGNTKYLVSNNTDSEDTITTRVTSFNGNGFSLGSHSIVNGNGNTYASWTFREQPKFFDVVTFTSSASGNKTFSHNLGAVPGCVIIKNTQTADPWLVYHRSVGDNAYLSLNSTAAQDPLTGAFSATSTTFTISSSLMYNSQTYVAYLFAHNAGGFGLTGTDNVISCGSFTGPTATVDLGYEPQWLLTKRVDSTGNWTLMDTMRGLVGSSSSGGVFLQPNTSNAENSQGQYTVNATGFNASVGVTSTFIYIAIRRGPMKTPTTGTSVFYPQTISQADIIDSTNVPFPPDLVNTFSRNGTNRSFTFNLFQFVDRLRGLGTPSNSFSTNSAGQGLTSSSTAAEYGGTGSYVQLKADSQNIMRGPSWNSSSYGNWIYYFMRRAPGFFDVVCYTGTGSARTVTHNLTVVPELMIVKRRDNVGNWVVYSADVGATKWLLLNGDIAPTVTSGVWNNTAPAASVFTVGTSGQVNSSGGTYVAYLFASCPGVSKVGSYTGNGVNAASGGQTINCGFTGGARFVLVKRTDSTGNWFVFDSARGIVAGADPYLWLNSTNAEVASIDVVDAVSSGFIVNQEANTNLNVNGATYIFLAIA